MADLADHYAQAWDRLAKNPDGTSAWRARLRKESGELINLLIQISILREYSSVMAIETQIIALGLYAERMHDLLPISGPLSLKRSNQTGPLSLRQKRGIVRFYNLLESGDPDFPIDREGQNAMMD